MELTERKKKVLRTIVDMYIHTAEPVGSKAIAELQDMNYSSATIRSEMADLAAQLEKAGNKAAFEQVMAAVSDFEKGNMRLSMVLQSLQ